MSATLPSPAPPARRRPSAWGWLVTVSATLVVGCAAALAIWWLVTSRETVTTYTVEGTVNAVVLDLGLANATIVGGGDRQAIEVRRTDRYAFRRTAQSERTASGGTLTIRSRCPRTVLHSCSASYRLIVPDNVAVTVRTTSGTVRMVGYRGSGEIDTNSGDVTVDGVCGFGLRARSQSGDVSAGTACPIGSLDLRSGTGDVRAVVPPGRYVVDAESDSGKRAVHGVIATQDAPFTIQALSSSGNVDVEASE